MSANSGNIDVVTDVSHLIDVPSCPHGPTLLFSKFEQGEKKEDAKERRFFACSAFRDRKQCPFFQYEREKISAEKKLAREDLNKKQLPQFTHTEYRKRFSQVKKLTQKERSLCENCGLLLLPGEHQKHKGQGHKLRSLISSHQLLHPTQLFTPKDDNKTYAQYLFSKSTVDFVLQILKEKAITHVLCVGCPRIHEAIQTARDGVDVLEAALQSLLLDLDHRYYQMYSPATFCRYNMFNHHFFDRPQAESRFSEFLREDIGKSVAMVIDPPFGGMVDALAHSISRIQTEWHSLLAGTKASTTAKLPVLWFFPYFMEKRITDVPGGFQMLDYKVDYDNHMLFKVGEKGRKKGSPVRIFTNLSPSDIKLPDGEGYWFCDACNRYSAPENKHCEKCDSCTTKDGNTYLHCDACGRCVKPSRRHCNVCNTCDLPQHTCGRNLAKGCHICGELGHKRRDCPVKTSNQLVQAKRPQKRKQKCKNKTVKRQKISS